VIGIDWCHCQSRYAPYATMPTPWILHTCKRQSVTRRLVGAFRTVFTEQSPLSFEAYSPRGGLPSRVLRFRGQRVVDMGNYCNTCALLFAHLANPAQRVSIEALAAQLASGIFTRDVFRVLETISPALPQGSYEVSLLEIAPHMVQRGSADDYFVTDRPLLWTFPGDAGDPRIDYYRGTTTPIPPDATLYEFVVPLYDMARLKPEVVKQYERSIARGTKPTALAITLLDHRQPAMWSADPPVTQHYLLAHYLLDGHHKVRAAAEANRPFTLLSFLARDHSMATLEDVVTVFGCLDNGA
jgi:hypothetical protein